MNGIILAAVVGVLFFLAVGSGLDILFKFAYTALGVLVIAFAWAKLSLRGVSLERRAAALRGQVGDELSEHFTLHNGSLIPKAWLAMQDYSSLPDHRVGRALSPKPHSDLKWRVSTICKARGRFQLGPAMLRSGDPFGLFEERRRVGNGVTVVVYPATAHLTHFPLPGGALFGGSNRRERTDQVTPNAAGVREYVAGDSFNRIHWLSTARLSKLMVKEFEPDPIADLWIALDMDGTVHAGTAPESSEEYAVHAAASLARHFLSQGWAVGLLSVAEQHHDLPPERGDRQLLKLMEELAVIRASGTAPLGELLISEDARFGRRTTVIAISPSTSLDWVAALRSYLARGVRTVAMVIDASSFGGPEPSGEVTAALQGAGIATYVFGKGDRLADVVAAGTAAVATSNA